MPPTWSSLLQRPTLGSGIVLKPDQSWRGDLSKFRLLMASRSPRPKLHASIINSRFLQTLGMRFWMVLAFRLNIWSWIFPLNMVSFLSPPFFNLFHLFWFFNFLSLPSYFPPFPLFLRFSSFTSFFSFFFFVTTNYICGNNDIFLLFLGSPMADPRLCFFLCFRRS